MNKVGLLHNLDHMSEEQQMDYILNGTSYDHEEIFEDVNDEVKRAAIGGHLWPTILANVNIDLCFRTLELFH